MYKKRSLLLCALVCMLFIGISTASAIPKLRLRKIRAEEGKVVLSVSLGKKMKRRYHLYLQASINGEDFVTIQDFSSRARKNKFIFLTEAGGIYSFRARLQLGKKNGRTAWSNSLLVIVSPSLNSEPDLQDKDSDPPDIEWPALSAGLTECDPGLEDQIFSLVNSVRSENGLPELSQNFELTVAARNHSNWMAEVRDLSHAGWFDGVLATGIWGSHFSQNIARYIKDPIFLVAAWLGSQAHAQNILNSKDSFTGISCVRDANGAHYWSQNFGG